MTKIDYALILLLFSSMSTVIGAIVILIPKINQTKYLSLCLSISGTVMTNMVVFDLYPKTLELMKKDSFNINFLSLFAIGFFLVYLIEKLTPNISKVLKMSLFIPCLIMINNFPEGLLTLLSALESPTLGLRVAISIGINNIPEGLLVALPVYLFTKSKVKADFLGMHGGNY